jgi:hypothetical protein
MTRHGVYRTSLRAGGYTFEGFFEAHYEVELDPISDDYDPEEISAKELFSIWLPQVLEIYPNGLVPITWFISCEEHMKYEFMPFQNWNLIGKMEDFLDRYTWPVDTESGRKMNFLSLKVRDKRWAKRNDHKGGFIQECTGWKPSALQPYIYVPSLVQAV